MPTVVAIVTPDDLLPMAAAIADLQQRVAVLEHAPPIPIPPPANQPSADGTFITAVGGIIVDDNGNKYTLIDSSAAGKGLQIVKNGTVSAPTQFVTTLGITKRKVVQENKSNNWYTDTTPGVNSTTATWVPIPDPTLPGPAPSKYYTVHNGQVYKPDGTSVFKGKGPNLKFLNWPGNLNTVIQFPIANKSNCTPLLSTFAGTTMVRLDAFESMDQLGVASLAALTPWVDALVANGIVVEIECHIYPAPLSGSDLSQVCNWYSQIAAHYIDTPNVWFGMQNEPDPTKGDVNAMMKAIYNAIRSTGNGTPIMMCVDSYDGLDAAMLQGFKNVLWDQHFYGWTSGYSTDQATVDANLAGYWQTSQKYKSADGVIPMLIGEFGTAGFYNTSGGCFIDDNQGIDNNWSQVLTAVYKASSPTGWAVGCLQWAWNTLYTSESNPPPAIDLLLEPPYDGSAVTKYGGQQLQAFLKQ